MAGVPSISVTSSFDDDDCSAHPREEEHAADAYAAVGLGLSRFCRVDMGALLPARFIAKLLRGRHASSARDHVV
ncbi:hypothetical protein ACH9EU_17085 [Kocuria sp. M1R5S2]|uniref:hypothetical protein n=1 Tax=Kocuria rhizosphaerae TaxID=3376285 RepID=UPI0037B213F5